MSKISQTNFFRIAVVLFILLAISVAGYFAYDSKTKSQQFDSLQSEKTQAVQSLDDLRREFEEFKAQDQVQINEKLNDEINDINASYKQAIGVYENYLDLEATTGKKYGELQSSLAMALNFLADRDYESANTALGELTDSITRINAEYLATLAPTPNPQDPTETASAPVNNTPPGSGYSRQIVSTSIGNYTVSIVAADIGSTRVLVDTAGDGDCTDNCPVLSLADYVTRNGGYAGINGTYFCPADYPSCAGKTNSFDLLVMNHKKTYFNSANNVYSNNPAVIFGEGYVRFVSAASQWGRDTSPTGVISNYPLLVFNNGITFQGDGDPKKGSKANRSFVAQQGNNVYIGAVHNATVAESAIVLHTMGMSNAMNLDSGGSTALYSGGYKLGPGRNLPNAIIFK